MKWLFVVTIDFKVDVVCETFTQKFLWKWRVNCERTVLGVTIDSKVDVDYEPSQLIHRSTLLKAFLVVDSGKE